MILIIQALFVRRGMQENKQLGKNFLSSSAVEIYAKVGIGCRDNFSGKLILENLEKVFLM